MNKTTLACPPLTPDDMLVLKGEPRAKITYPAPHRRGPSEEWVYLSIPTRTEEHYLFRNGRLAGWRKTAL